MSARSNDGESTDDLGAPIEEPTVPITDFETVMRTTRSVRKRLDLERPVDPQVLLDCFEIALQAPTGGYAQDWRFLVVTDPELRRAIASRYEQAYEEEVAAALADRSLYARKVKGRLGEADDGEGKARIERILSGAEHLARHLAQVPVHVIACASRPSPRQGGPGTMSALYGSVYPAVWSFQLALRSRGLGSLITTLHLHHEDEIARVLGIPDGVTQVCLLPVAHTVGLSFREAARRPIGEVVFHDRWGAPLNGSAHTD